MAGNRPAPNGALGAINIFTCTPTTWTWLSQRRGFWLSRMARWRTGTFTGREVGSFTLQRLDILHTATWLRLGRFPRIAGAAPERLRHVLFCSNFAGEWDPYRQAFLDVLGSGIRKMWGPSVGFARSPKVPRPGSRYLLEEWQHHRLPLTLHYYRAYPGTAPSEVRGAVRLSRAVEAFAFRAQSPPTQLKNQALVASFRQLQRSVATTLGASPPNVVHGATCGPPTATGMSNFVSALPIVLEREQLVLERIRRLPDGDASPFRLVEGTHFARLALLDRRTASMHPQKTIVLENSWLVFAADIDGHFGVHEANRRKMDAREVSRYMSAVERTAGLRDLWRDCVGFDSGRSLADLVVPSVVERFVLFLDHGDTTLREIDHGLKVKHAYQRALETNRLDNEQDIEQFLATVRAGA